MKNILLLALYICVTLSHAPAQTSRIEYTTIVKLNPGEEVVNLLSCWKPDGNKAPSQIVIRNPDKTFSTITGSIRKDHLTYEQVGANNCNDNPYQVQRDSYSNIYRHPLPNGKFNLHHEKKDYGTYDNILFMRVSGSRFVAVVAEGTGKTTEYFFLDSEGGKISLDGRAENLVTNDDLSRSAVVLARKGTTPAEAALDPTRKVWLDDGRTFTIQRKSRILFDVAGRHFIEVQYNTFYIDGIAVGRNVSNPHTQLFVSPDGKSWAYHSEIYMGFSNNTYFKDVFHPFLTTEEGKEYLNWFAVQKENNVMVVKLGKRSW
ncbi:MAG TPA: hypothetical protein VHC48_09460 [Puia sp.]|nr:hypothetical protein [Puia sp.]